MVEGAAGRLVFGVSRRRGGAEVVQIANMEVAMWDFSWNWRNLILIGGWIAVLYYLYTQTTFFNTFLP